MSPVPIGRADPEIVALEMGGFRFPDDDPLAGQLGVAMAYAVRHAGGTLLFDTGFGFGSAKLDARYPTRPRALPDVLLEAGIALEEIDAVVNCHLHADHAGQNASFPGVPIFVQPIEWETAHATDHTILEWIDFASSSYELRAGAHEVRPGIRVLPTPGHTAGHQSLVIDTSAGRIILAGQAAYSVEEFSGVPTAWEGRTSTRDQAAYDASLETLRGLRPVRVLFGHDRREWTA